MIWYTTARCQSLQSNVMFTVVVLANGRGVFSQRLLFGPMARFPGFSQKDLRINVAEMAGPVIWLLLIRNLGNI